MAGFTYRGYTVEVTRDEDGYWNARVRLLNADGTLTHVRTFGGYDDRHTAEAVAVEAIDVAEGPAEYAGEVNPAERFEDEYIAPPFD